MLKEGVPKEENSVCTCKCLLQASTEIEAMVPGENRNQLQTFLIFYMLKCWYPFSLITMRASFSVRNIWLDLNWYGPDFGQKLFILI